MNSKNRRRHYYFFLFVEALSRVRTTISCIKLLIINVGDRIKKRESRERKESLHWKDDKLHKYYGIFYFLFVRERERV